jgi:putative transposase
MTLSNRRRSLRLKGYDYGQAGAYFVTICTHGRVCLLREAAGDTICLNAAGQLVATLWSDLPIRFPDVDLDAFVVMPNHIHGIVVLSDDAVTVAAPLVDARVAGRAVTRAAPTDR